MPEPQFHQSGMGANQSFDWSLILPHLDQITELKGIRVVCYDGYKMHVVREGPPFIDRDARALVIKPSVGEFSLRNADFAAAHEGAFYKELFNTTVGCSGMIASWVCVWGGGAAVPITGGASLLVEKLAVPAALAGTVSCANSSLRLYNEAYRPEKNDEWDQNAWYTRTANFLDAFGLVGVGTGTSSTLKLVGHLRSTTGKSLINILKGMKLNRRQRELLAEEAIRRANPGIGWYAMKQMIKAGTYPRRYAQSEITHTVRMQLVEAFGVISGFSGSTYDGVINKAAKSVRDAVVPPKQMDTFYGDYVIGIVQAFETFN